MYSKEKMKEYQRNWYAANKKRLYEKRKEYRKSYVWPNGKAKDKVWRDKNRDKVNMQAKAWRDNNQLQWRKLQQKSYQRNKVSRRAEQLRYKYGITKYDYDVLLQKQNGLCAICHCEEVVIYKDKQKALSVDHNHRNGKIRGLLCTNCNVGIAQFFDSIGLLYAAIDYLKGSA